MNISRGEVSEFHYSSALSASKENIIDRGTTNNKSYNILISDLKMSCGGSARTVKFYQATVSGGKSIELDMPADTIANLTWEIPFKIYMTASTTESRPFVGSASGTGVKYSISGYIEK